MQTIRNSLKKFKDHIGNLQRLEIICVGCISKHLRMIKKVVLKSICDSNHLSSLVPYLYATSESQKSLTKASLSKG